MKETEKTVGTQLSEHFFRNEYGRIVSVITRYLGVDHVESAEDIVQETLLKAVENWQQNGLPENPQAWLYTTAKNLAINKLRRREYQWRYEKAMTGKSEEMEQFNFSEEMIQDDQLKMMFACCHPSISENTQISLILKILCGFSISEIASAFFTSNETINKRLVRGRSQLRKNNISFELPKDVNAEVPIVLKTIYLLFNEGYSPSQKNHVVRFDLCLEAIRLTKILLSSDAISEKTDSYSLLALMHLNASRFEARMDDEGSIVEMEKQDRRKWDRDLINNGIHYLHKATETSSITRYLILAAISAQHCIAPTYQETNWDEILSLYNTLLLIEDSPTIRMNRSVALAKVEGIESAIEELHKIDSISAIGSHYLFHSTLAALYKDKNDISMAIEHLKKAISLTQNERDIKLLKKKLIELVPIS